MNAQTELKTLKKIFDEPPIYDYGMIDPNNWDKSFHEVEYENFKLQPGFYSNLTPKELITQYENFTDEIRRGMPPDHQFLDMFLYQYLACCHEARKEFRGPRNIISVAKLILMLHDKNIKLYFKYTNKDIPPSILFENVFGNSDRIKVRINESDGAYIVEYSFHLSQLLNHPDHHDPILQDILLRFLMGGTGEIALDLAYADNIGALLLIISSLWGDLSFDVSGENLQKNTLLIGKMLNAMLPYLAQFGYTYHNTILQKYINAFFGFMAHAKTQTIKKFFGKIMTVESVKGQILLRRGFVLVAPFAPYDSKKIKVRDAANYISCMKYTFQAVEFAAKFFGSVRRHKTRSKMFRALKNNFAAIYKNRPLYEYIIDKYCEYSKSKINAVEYKYFIEVPLIYVPYAELTEKKDIGREDIEDYIDELYACNDQNIAKLGADLRAGPKLDLLAALNQTFKPVRSGPD